MNRPRHNIEWLVWGALALTSLTIAAAFVWSRLNGMGAGSARLPIINASLPEVSLTNQLGEVFTPSSLRGQVWVADVIFTRCAGPCPEMTKKMSQLQAAVPGDAPVRFVTLSTDPEFDTPGVLRRYAERFGALSDRWMFLTGSRKDLARLTVEGLKLTALEKKPYDQATPEDLFIHSTLFVVVDRRGRLRAAVETDEPGWKESVQGTIKALLREKEDR